MGKHISILGLLPLASVVAICFAAGCSGSGDGSPGGDTADGQPTQIASAQDQTAPPASSANASAAPPSSANRPGAPAGSANPPGAPPGGGDTSTPKQCTSEQDCTGACPAGAKGCTCADAPDGNKRCIATCTADADCPTVPGKTLMCSAQKICVPKS